LPISGPNRFPRSTKAVLSSCSQINILKSTSTAAILASCTPELLSATSCGPCRVALRCTSCHSCPTLRLGCTQSAPGQARIASSCPAATARHAYGARLACLRDRGPAIALPGGGPPGCTPANSQPATTVAMKTRVATVAAI